MTSTADENLDSQAHQPARAAAPGSSLTNWLFGPAALAAIGLGTAAVRSGPSWVLGLTLGLMLGGTFLWVFVSVLWPSKANKTCPVCGEDTIRRANENSTRGVVCASCGHEDSSASSFYLAEESDEPMEPMLLAGRPRRPGRSGRLEHSGQSAERRPASETSEPEESAATPEVLS